MSKLYIKYEHDGNIFSDLFLDNKNSNNHFKMVREQIGERTKLIIVPKDNIKIKLLSVNLELSEKYSDSSKVYCNGYQSWSYSDIYNKFEKQDKLSLLTNLFTKKIGLKNYSDYYFYDRKIKKGIFRSYSYTYIKTKDIYTLYGSLDEKFAFTIFRHNMNKNMLEIIKDIKGRVINKETVLFDYIVKKGEYNILDEYFTSISEGNKRMAPERLLGFTSWYNYFKNIDEEIMFTALESLEEGNIFQIDDGYQTFVGDWKNIDKTKFPNGLSPLVSKIKDKNLLSGIWIAPFVCEEKSALFKYHQDFLLKNELGKPYYLGNNWSGFYALDITNIEVQKYLKECFENIFNLGFDLVKVDFLYAACMMPNENMTRSELMNYATSLIRSWCGDKLILGCGVPLSSAYNKFDYCRIGCDVSLNFAGDKNMKFMGKCPGPSTKNTLIDTINRNPMNGKVFINDPDVYILRKDNHKLDHKQKEALAILNTLLGGVNLHSDVVNDLPEISKELLNKLPLFYDSKVLDITKYVSTYKIKLIKDNEISTIDYNFLKGYILD